MKNARLWIALIVLMIACACLCCASAEIIASGDCGKNGDNITWTFDSEGVLSINGRGLMLNCGNAPWKNYLNEIKSAIISEGVTNISEGAFSDCGNLTNVTIPDSVTRIGDSAFNYCNSLKSIVIPDSVTSIDRCAFRNCGGLTNIIIPDGVTCISDYVFSYCSNLTSITIPDSVTSIGRDAFYDCKLTSVEIPYGVTSIGNNAFGYCSSLTSITIPASVTSIGSGAIPRIALLYCYADSYADKWAKETGKIDNICYLSDIAITLPENISIVRGEEKPLEYTIVPDGACDVFWTSDDPTIAAVSENGVVIGVSTGVTTITATVKSGKSARCTVTVAAPAIIASGDCGAAGDNIQWALDLGGLLSITGTGAMEDYLERYHDKAISSTAPWNDHRSEIKSVIISEGVTNIGNSAFCGSSNLTSIVIPDSVTSIGHDAFTECISLTSITIPNGVASIGSDAIPNATLIYCHADSYADTWAAENGRIGKVRRKIIASGDCGAGGDNLVWTLDWDGLLSISGTGKMADYDGDEFNSAPWPNYSADIKSAVIAEGATSVGSLAFYTCENITDIELPDGITTIGRAAFSGCTRLENIVIPDSVTVMHSGVFHNCASLESIVIPNSVKDLDTWSLFGGCSKLTNVTLPEGITHIGGGTFEGCTGLRHIEIPAGVERIIDCAFVDCTNLESVVFNEGITEILNGVFQNCTSLVSIRIPDGVTNIGYHAFYNCTGLETIVIPASVTIIGEDAIPDTALIYCHAGSYADAWAMENGRGENVRHIGDSATVARLPAGLTEIRDEAYLNTAVEIVRLPESCTKIGARAFANCTQLRHIEIPAMNIEIADDAFANSPNVVIHAPAGSAAQTYARAHGITFLAD